MEAYQLRRKVWEDVSAGVSFSQWVRIGDEHLVGLAVDRAIELFTEELNQLRPQPWVAHIPMGQWVALHLVERLQLDGAFFHEDHVVVEGAGEVPALIETWAVPA